MFEYVIRKRDPIAIAFYVGCVPFGLAWAFHQSMITGFLLEAYLITCMTFAFMPFEVYQNRAKQPWFWKSMIRKGVLVHPVFLAAVWFLDATYPAFVTGTGTIFFIGFVIGVAEAVLLGEIVDRTQPAN